MKKTKFYLPISIILSCVILGVFYYLTQVNKYRVDSSNQIIEQQSDKVQQMLLTEPDSDVKSEVDVTSQEIKVVEPPVTKQTVLEEPTVEDLLEQGRQRIERMEEIEASKSYVTIKEFSGSGNTITEDFYITGNKFKVIYKYINKSDLFSGSFWVYAENVEDSLERCKIVSFTGDSLSNYGLCNEGPGIFRLDVSLSDGVWSATVQDYK